MASEVFSFLWPVPMNGHKWIQARVHGDEEDGPQWVLTEGLAIGDNYNARFYAPLKAKEYAGLFRTFANLRYEDRDAILDFANRFGQLGIRTLIDTVIERDGKRLMSGGGETWQDWMHQIVEMRLAVAIWDMIEARDLSGLSRHVQWTERGWCYDSLDLSHDSSGKAMPPGSPVRRLTWIPPVLDLFKPDDVLMPASFLVQRWINDYLKQASPQLRYDLDRGKRVLQIIPDSLLGAMWLQFAQAIDGNRKHRACKECGRWFEISTEETGLRVNRVFCSDPCKSRDYRRRKQMAQQLKAEGNAIATIAKELDTDIETIRKGVTTKPRRKGS
jgi:hypothetical protein